MEFLTAYGEKSRVGFVCIGESRTKQSFTKECNINNIMSKYQKSGAISHFNQHSAEYGFATGQSFSEAMLLVVQAQDMFEGLPSSIRSRFGNNPATFLDFVQDANNADEMIALGLRDAPASNEDSAAAPPPTPEPPPGGEAIVAPAAPGTVSP